MDQLEFFREVSRAIASDQQWNGEYSRDGNAISITRGDNLQMCFRDSKFKGTAIDCFVNGTALRLIED